MTSPTDIVERMAGMNPVPDPTTVDESRLAVLASVVEERRSGMIETRPPERREAPRTRSRKALAFASGLVLVLVVIAGVAILPGGGGTDVGDEPSPPTTGPVPSTTAPPGETTVAPRDDLTKSTSTAPPPRALPFDEVLDDSAAALLTSMALAGDGSPVIVSIVSDANAAGSYEEATISVARLLVCRDPACAEPPVTVDLGAVAGWAGGPLRVGLDPFDRPVVLYPRGERHPAGEGHVVVFCDDPVCSGFETRRAEEGHVWGFGQFDNWAFAPDGNPVYPEFPPDGSDGLDLVACLDRFCDESTRTRIDTGSFIGSWTAPRVAADGSVLLVYSTEGSTGTDKGFQKVAWCADAMCLDGPVVTTIDEGTRVGWGYPVEGAAGPEIWYTSTEDAARGPAWVVTDAKATCLNPACTEFDKTYLGRQEFFDGDQWRPPPDVVAPDGSRLGLENGLRVVGRLALTRYVDDETWTSTIVATAECNDPIHGGYCEELYKASLAVGAGGLPIVAYGDDLGVHVVRCPDLACTPPDQ